MWMAPPRRLTIVQSPPLFERSSQMFISTSDRIRVLQREIETLEISTYASRCGRGQGDFASKRATLTRKKLQLKQLQQAAKPQAVATVCPLCFNPRCVQHLR